MTTATYWQRGETLDYTNTTDALIEHGTVLTLGARIGVAGCDIPPGAIGTVHVDGIYRMPKAKGTEIDMGALVEWSPGTGTIAPATGAAAQAEGDEAAAVVAGYAAEPAAADAATVLVKINA